jgi:hypothetical protein
MPSWRRTEKPRDWPLNREMPAGSSWSETRLGGANGLVIVLIAVSWWLVQAKTSSQRGEVESVLEDLLFAFMAMNAN